MAKLFIPVERYGVKRWVSLDFSFMVIDYETNAVIVKKDTAENCAHIAKLLNEEYSIYTTTILEYCFPHQLRITLNDTIWSRKAYKTDFWWRYK